MSITFSSFNVKAATVKDVWKRMSNGFAVRPDKNKPTVIYLIGKDGKLYCTDTECSGEMKLTEVFCFTMNKDIAEMDLAFISDMHKADIFEGNKDIWFSRHSNNECPVSDDYVLNIRMENGEIHKGLIPSKICWKQLNDNSHSYNVMQYQISGLNKGE